LNSEVVNSSVVHLWGCPQLRRQETGNGQG
jgi:hypothetical protein